MSPTIYTDALMPTITIPPNLHAFGKRHFFTCGDLTLSWEHEWYTAPFFLSDRSFFDRAASRGAVNPPLNVYQTVEACQRELGITVESTIKTTTNSDGVAIWTTETSVSTTRSGLAAVTRTTGIVTGTSSLTLISPSDSSGLGSSSLSVLATLTSSSLPSSTTSSIAPYASDPAQVLSSINSCAGDLDWQAWGAVSNVAFGVLVGVLLWATWAFLRGHMPGFYSSRTWFVPRG